MGKQSPAEIAEILTALAETPQRIAFMTQDVEVARLHAPPDRDSWSVNDILAHLRACADVWGKGIGLMIAQDQPTVRYISPRTWLRKTDYRVQEFQLSLPTFARQRDDLLKLLNTLEIADWSRGATFTETAKEHQETVFSYARRIAHHEARHLNQLESLLVTLSNNSDL